MNKIMLVFEVSAGCPEKRYCLRGDFRYELGLDDCFRGEHFHLIRSAHADERHSWSWRRSEGGEECWGLKKQR